MTKVIVKPQPHGRVAGKFVVGVNGTIYRLTVGEEFADNAALLAALDGAGVSYAEPGYTATSGSPTGRIKILSVDTRILLCINGAAVSRVSGNVFFTPTAAELEAIRNSTLTWILEYGAPQGGDAGIGDEIFPMPAWAAESGIVSNVGWTIAGGLGTCVEDAVLTVTLTKNMIEGIYRVGTIFTAPSGAYGAAMGIGLPAGLNGGSLGDGTTGVLKTLDIVVDQLGANTITLSESQGLLLRLTEFSVKRIS